MRNFILIKIKLSFIAIVTILSICYVEPMTLQAQTPVVGIPAYYNGNSAGNTNESFVAVQYAPGQGASSLSTGLTKLANMQHTGTTWGVAYDSRINNFYAGAVLKRHAGYGPNGSGAIYKINAANVTPAASLLINLDGATGTLPGGGSITINTGDATDHGILGTPTQDNPAFSLVGKSGLGDIDISTTNNTLWVINAKQQQLIEVNISNPNSPTIGKVYPITNSSTGITPTDGVLRPWALEIGNDNSIYVGVVATAENVTPAAPITAGPANFNLTSIRESPANRAKLQAYVFKLDILTGNFTQVLNFPLDYARGNPGVGISNTIAWLPWFDDYTLGFPNVGDGYFQLYPQPIVSDIEIIDDGSMMVALLDRYGLQTGSEGNSKPGGAVTFNENGRPCGDVLRFTSAGGGLWNSSPTNLYGDAMSAPEDDAAMGAIAFKPGTTEFIGTTIDAINSNSNGIVVVSNSGVVQDNQDLLSYAGGNTLLASKGMALGDVEIGNVGAAPCVQPSSVAINVSSPTCSAGAPNNDGKIILTSLLNGDRYGISTGGTYTGVNYTSATSIINLPDTLINNIQNSPSITYTIRIFNGSDTCFKDTTITTTVVTCGPSPYISNPCTAGLVGGRVFNDINSNGLRDITDTFGFSNIKVYAYDCNGNKIDSTTSDYFGRYTFNSVFSAYPVRIEFDRTTFPTWAQESFAGSDNNTDLQILNAADCNVDLGLKKEGDYCQANPLVVNARNYIGNATGTGATLNGTYYTTPSSTAPTVTNFSSNTATGTTYGVAYSKSSKTLFNSAVVRNYMNYGPGGFDAIYTYAFNDANGSATPAATMTQGTTIDLSALGVNVGTAPRTGPLTGTNPYVDNATLYQKIGKIGIGDIETDASGDTLFVINMNDGFPSLVILNVANPSATTLIAEVPINVNPCTNGVFRPWAVEYYNGKPYIGGVCDAATGTVANLTASIYRYDGGGVFTQVIQFPLNYQRGKTTFRADGTNTSANWKPWTNTWAPQTLALSPATIASQPQPMFTDIEFMDDGSITVAFSDRFAYQNAFQQRRYDVTTGTAYFTTPAGGDVLKICNNIGSYSAEGVGGCTQSNTDNSSITTLNPINAPTGVKEFYDDDYYNTGSSSTGQAGHAETSLGALAILPGSGQILVSAFDPVTTTAPGGTSGPVNTSGIRTYVSGTGNYAKGWVLVAETDPGANRKGGNMGDIEILCDGAPMQIGNRVWVDSDGDGVQDACEPPIAGVIVTLWKNGVQIASATTNASGEYYFSQKAVSGVTWTGTGADTALLPNTAYEIRIATNQSPITTPGYILTQVNSSTSNDQNDNDANNVGANAVITLTTGEGGSVNHTYDFGFTPVGSIGNYVWSDSNSNGIKDEVATAGLANVKVYLLDSSGNIIDSTTTNSSGFYIFDSLRSGTYYVQFPTTNAGNNLTNQTINLQTDNNSDANISTGISPAIVINAAGTGLDKNNNTIDAGYLVPEPLGSLGNYVWYDLNNNGLQDEPISAGISGVKVYLLNALNTIIDSTVTNATGYYLFDSLASGTYGVEFPITIGTNTLTTTNATPQIDGNSDANTATGRVTGIIINATGTGVAKDNMTIDAGYVSPPTYGSLGNYVWRDVNGDGIQNEAPTEGLAGVEVYLLNASNIIIDSVITDANGFYLFDSLSAGTYGVKFPTNVGGNNLTTPNATPQTDGNSDANSNDGTVTGIVIDPLGVGVNKDNMTIDVGYKPLGSIGNYVWTDINGDGIQNEPASFGINGIKVYLLNGSSTIIDSTVTAPDLSGNPGYYLFPNLTSGNYFVQFPTSNGTNNLTQPTTIAQTDLNSDANITTGISPVIVINVVGTGMDKDNMTIDAGYYPVGSIGNYVWLDNNRNGTQDELDSLGFNGIAIYLKDANTNAIIDSTVTINGGSNNAPGYYLFDSLASGNYKVVFPLAIGNATITPVANPTTNVDGNNNLLATGGESDVVVIDANGTGVNKDNMTIDAGYWLPASIGNRVWLDNNKNGVQDVGEPGVAGVTVTLFDSGYFYAGSAITDAYGNYKFNNLIPGDYAIQFTPPANYAFTVSNTPGDNLNDANSDADTTYGFFYGTTPMFNLTPGEYDSTVDCGIILPTPFTAIVGDYVWLDANKDGVQDPTEKGLSNVVVTLVDNAGNPVASTVTDGDGRYLFTNVIPGNYTIQFSKPIGYEVSPLNIGANDSTDSDININTYSTAPFTVNAGDDNRTFDAGFYPGDSSKCALGNLVWYDKDNNGIQNVGEQGVQGVTVYLLDISSNKIDSTVTNILGEYIFDNLNAGTYSVEFSLATLPSGYSFTAQNAVANDAIDGDENASGLTGQYTLIAGERNMTVDAGVYNATNNNSLGDRVWLDANKDGIQDIGEEGVTGVTVTLYNATTNLPLVTTMTDKDGLYRFDGLPDGSYYVGFSNLPNGMNFTGQNTVGSTASNGSDANAMNGKTAPVALSGGIHNPDLDAGIYPQGTPSQTASIGNRVWYDINNDGVQNLGEPGVQNAIATLLDAGPDGILGNGDDGSSKYMYTDANGEYLFTGLPAGNYAVEFSSLPANYSFTVGNTSDDEKDSDVPAGGTVATTSVYALAAGEENLTIDAGIYNSVVNNIGNYVWYDVNKDGIQDATEIGVKGVEVILLHEDGSIYDFMPNDLGVQPYVIITDADGYYLFTNLPDGTYKVRFGNLPLGYELTAPNTGTNDSLDSNADTTTLTTGAVTVIGGQTDLTLDAGIFSDSRAALGNYVWVDSDKDGLQDSTEKPIAGVLVTLYDNTNTPIATTVTDAGGNYMFTNLLPGTYSVGFTNLPDGTIFTTQNADPDLGSDVNPTTGKTATVTLAAGDINTSLDAGVIPVETGGLGNYVWYDANQDGVQAATEIGVAGVSVNLYDGVSNNLIATAITDGSGYYLFPNLDPTKTYYVEFNGIPLSYSFTQNNGPITDITNSDANTTTGITTIASVPVNSINPSVDAGIIINFGSIGNFVWVDSNQNGLNDETALAAIPNVEIYLLDSNSNIIDSTITDATGYYLFDSLRNGVYTVRFPVISGTFVLTNPTVTPQVDNNSDADYVSGLSPTVTISVSGTGQDKDNTTIDAGYTSLGSIGTYVWIDSNANGIYDEDSTAGVNGITVYLLDSNQNIIDSTVTVTDSLGKPGYYVFPRIPSGVYYVQFPTNIGGGLTTQDSTANTPGNSDPNTTTGISTPILIDGFGTGVNKDNPTIFAGYLPVMPLPIDGLVLSAVKQSKQNYITWSSINPIDVQKYELLKGNSLSSMQVIDIQNLNALNKYEYADKEIYNGETYYKVVAYDLFGHTTESGIKVITRFDNLEVSAYPNPVKDILNIKFNDNLKSETIINIFDASGKKVLSTLGSKNSKLILVDVSSLASGNYTIHFNLVSGNIVIPFIKVD